MAPADMSWIVARRLAALVVTTGLLLPAIHAAAIDQQQQQQPQRNTPRNEVAGNDFDNSIPSFADEKSVDSVNEASDFLIRCYCNMPACLAASGGVRTCTTRLGCFSQLQPDLPNLDGTVTHPVSTTTTQKMTTLIPEEFDVEAAIYGNDNALNGDYGCLDLLPINKTCDEVLKLMEKEESEFPFIQTGTSSQSVDNVVSAYHCCEEDMCNDRSHVAASATNAEASLIAAFEKSMNQIKYFPKTTTTTEEPSYLPIPLAFVSKRKDVPKTTITTEEPASLPVPIAFVSGRKELFVNVGNIAPDIFPNTDNNTDTMDLSISSSEAKDITAFVTKNIGSINNKTTPVVVGTTFSSLVSNTNITSNETNVTSNTNVKFTKINPMVNTTTAGITTIKKVTSNSMDIDSEKNRTTTSTIMFNANMSSLTTNTTDYNASKDVVFFFDNTSSTEVNSGENSEVPLKSIAVSYKENNVTSSITDIDIATNTTSEILNAPMPNISEIIVPDSNLTSTAPFVIINTTEVITSKTETEQKQEFNSGKLFREMIRRQDSPRALAFHKSPGEKTTSVTPLEDVIDNTKSFDNSELLTAQENNSHIPMDPSYNRHRSVDKTHYKSAAEDVTPSSGFLDWTGIPQWIEGVTGILAICGVIGVTIVALAAIKIVRKTDVFEHYKSVCSNPGQPCACNGGLGSRRSRQLTSSSTVYRNTTASIQPVLPPPNNSLYGLTYVDSTGNSTHVYTPIPVPL